MNANNLMTISDTIFGTKFQHSNIKICKLQCFNNENACTAHDIFLHAGQSL